MSVKKSLKILSVGNSFAVDTSEYAPEIARELGYDSVRIGTLYIGGCSIKRHYSNAQANAKAYVYYVNDGEGWSETENVSIEDAVKGEEWDFISIQHGTGDGSRYTNEESYEKLEPLVEYIRAKASPKTRIAFNMAWVMEPDGTHPEIRSYGGDQLRMYEQLARITERIVKPTRGLDIVSPAGTAIQNARATGRFGNLCRDGFHLSKSHGRYIAALTFLGSLTREKLDSVTFAPDGVNEEERKTAIGCAAKAIEKNFEIT